MRIDVFRAEKWWNCDAVVIPTGHYLLIFTSSTRLTWSERGKSYPSI